MEVRAAYRSERDEVLDLLSLWYNDREFFARYNQIDPAFRDELCLVARDGNRLVSTVQIFDRAINLDRQAAPMGGIGSVFTLEEYRHKGVASALMRLAVDTMTREGFEVSLLFAERLTFYNQFGWREVERKFSILSAAAAIKVRGKFTIDAFEPSRDLGAVAEIHRAYSGRFNVTAIRDEAAWRANLEFAGNQPMHPGEGSKEYFILCREAGRIAAYARVARFHGVSMVMEFGYLPDAPDAMLASFKYLGEVASRAPISFQREGDHRRAALLGGEDAQAAGLLITHTAHDAELERRLSDAGCPVAHHIDNNYMWRILAPGKLARRFETTADAASACAFEAFQDSRSLFWTADRF
ncbi:MAG: GNAT family N-acetyltransferase [Candidatus Binatus sp.]|uniref:GNAT family N-acetyltransferase n=1 Tax=Candidatus Binatus sp. TaxID=2811406 RepID=UPI00271F5EEF|nr:GNAT family N-acetyltransferase [Candidatus Binatus sp.]MDO8434228.1 GNAT family N-acetyltransferase [Candidatus Binatus sp.]